MYDYLLASRKKCPYSYLLLYIISKSIFQIPHLNQPTFERGKQHHHHSCSLVQYLLHSCIYILQASLYWPNIFLGAQNYILICYRVRQIISSIFDLRISFKLVLRVHVWTSKYFYLGFLMHLINLFYELCPSHRLRWVMQLFILQQPIYNNLFKNNTLTFYFFFYFFF